MKRVSTVLAVLTALLVAVPAFSQTYVPSASYDAGVYYAPNYAQYQVRVVTGNAAAGAGSLVLSSGAVTLPDGRVVTPFSTSVPVTIDIGANAETATPSAVSGCTLSSNQPAPAATCTLTFTSLSNVHGQGALVQSGDLGIQEAIQDAQNNGGGMVYWQIDSGGPITLNTGGANTNVTANGVAVNIPTRSTVMGAVGRVTTTIGTCAGGWSLGFSTGTEFTSANTTLTAGTTTDSSTLVPAVAFNAAATQPIIHCTTSNASAGAMHVKIYGYKMAAPIQ